MKKYLLVTLLACMAFTAQAKILRVNNTSGSSAPYTSISAALEEAVNGDTIMVDASDKSYGNITFNGDKKVVMIGPGYWLVKNGIVQEGMSSATLGTVTIRTEGVVIKGFTTSRVEIYMPNVVLQRCFVDGIIYIYEDVSNCVIHQNIIETGITGSNIRNLQITNNIFLSSNETWGGNVIRGAKGSYIAYNSFIRNIGNSKHFDVSNCTIEHNILCVEGNVSSTVSNSYSDNYTFGNVSPYGSYSYYEVIYDSAIQESELAFSEGKYGAFAGDDPYVISGVPSGPVIEDIVVPTTVEKGNTMSVTIKVGITK